MEKRRGPSLRSCTPSFLSGCPWGRSERRRYRGSCSRYSRGLPLRGGRDERHDVAVVGGALLAGEGQVGVCGTHVDRPLVSGGATDTKLPLHNTRMLYSGQRGLSCVASLPPSARVPTRDRKTSSYVGAAVLGGKIFAVGGSATPAGPCSKPSVCPEPGAPGTSTHEGPHLYCAVQICCCLPPCLLVTKQTSHVNVNVNVNVLSCALPCRCAEHR